MRSKSVFKNGLIKGVERKIYNKNQMITKLLRGLKLEMGLISKWAYLLFVVIAVVMGLVVGYMAWSEGGWDAVATVNGWVLLVLVVLGIMIGLTTITAKEVMPFLIATIALAVAAGANVWEPLCAVHDLLYFWATGILNYIVAFAAPAAVIIAIKEILTIAKEK